MRIGVLCAALGLGVFTGGAAAQSVSDTFLYQGELLEGGEPADGLYDLIFRLYEDEVGGNFILGTFDLVEDVEVVDGRFSCAVDFSGSNSALRDDQPRWLEIEVRPSGGGTGVVLDPRQPLLPAPRATYAIRSGTTLNAAHTNGPTIQLNGTQDPVEIEALDGVAAHLRLGSPTNLAGGAGLVNLYSEAEEQIRLDAGPDGSGAEFSMFNTQGEQTVRLSSSFFGGAEVELLDGNADRLIQIQQDIDGPGGYFFAPSDSALTRGVVLDANFDGTENPRLAVIGGSRDVIMDMSIPGDGAVELPVGSVTSAEIGDEPGVSDLSNLGNVLITPSATTPDTVDSISINAPADGYVLVLASVELEITHLNGQNSSINYGVSDIPGLFPAHGDLEFRIPSGAASGDYDFAATTHGLFEVDAGMNTFYLLVDQSHSASGSRVLDRQVTAVYLPTAYGAAGREAPANPAPDGAVTEAPMTALDVLRERNAALEADNARQQRELDAVRARMERIERTLGVQD